ncbi:MAG: precorrin-4 C(11)-methyltransferase, partial [Gordonia amarae]
PDALAAAAITKTAVIFVGRVLEPQGVQTITDSYLYSAARMSKLRSHR